MTELQLFSATYYGMNRHPTAESNTDLLFASEVGFWPGEGKENLLQNLYCYVTTAFFILLDKVFNRFIIFGAKHWEKSLKAPQISLIKTSAVLIFSTLKESLTPLGFLAPLQYQFIPGCSFERFYFELAKQNIGEARHSKRLSSKKDFDWIKIHCGSKDDSYVFIFKELYSTLAWAVCWRDKDPDAIQANHLAQVTEQLPPIAQKIPSWNISVLGCSTASKRKAARTEILSYERVLGHCVGPYHAHAN